jgi:outer membrane protein TolC
MIRQSWFLSSFLMLVLLACGTSGCTSRFYSKAADRETLGILFRKSSKVPNSGRGLFNIKPASPTNLEELRLNFDTEDFLGDRAYIEKGAKVVKLADALGYAVNRNRDYLTQKEDLYRLALDLTLARYQYTPIFAAAGEGTVDRTQIATGVNRFVTDNTQTFQGGTGFTMLSRTGTRLAADLSTDFLRFLTGGLREVSDSKLAVTLSQPLLQGAGYLGASEVLTQAERDTLYAIRDFTQYRKIFTVDTTAQYFRTLQARDRARNAHMAFINYGKTLDRETLMKDANKRSLPSLLQINQAYLTSKRNWMNAIRLYEQELDDLKIRLGIPVKTPLMLDSTELAKLAAIDPPGSLDEALETALATRLDLWNERDSLEDADRKVRVAKQSLLPAVNAIVRYNANGEPGANQINLDPRRNKVSAGVEFDLNLDRREERNSLRAAEVTVQTQKRNLDLAEETVRRDIRADWLDLQLAKKQYELAVEGLSLAEERLKVEVEFYEEGKTTNPRDLIDAQTGLITARDQVTTTVIAHTIARLELWKDMGILFITKDGAWMDVLKNEQPKGAE